MTLFVGHCAQCDWVTPAEANPLLAGIDAYTHERATDYLHHVRVTEKA